MLQKLAQCTGKLVSYHRLLIKCLRLCYIFIFRSENCIVGTCTAGMLLMFDEQNLDNEKVI